MLYGYCEQVDDLPGAVVGDVRAGDAPVARLDEDLRKGSGLRVGLG